MSGFFPGNRMTYFLSFQTVDKAEEGPIKSRPNLVTFVPSAFFLLSVRCNKKMKNEKKRNGNILGIDWRCGTQRVCKIEKERQ